MTVPVQLGDNQIRKIKEAWPKAGDLTAGPTAYDRAVQQVLTPEQKAAIAKYRVLAFVKAAFGRAELTKDQLKQAELVVEKLTKDPSVKPEDFHKTLTTRIEGLLTAEQLKAMKKPWTWKGGSPAGWGVSNALPGNHGKASEETDKE
jgi:hypothetical protein